jgi:hypothetical protein
MQTGEQAPGEREIMFLIDVLSNVGAQEEWII